MDDAEVLKLITFAEQAAALAVKAVIEIKKDLQGDPSAKPLAQLLDESDAKWLEIIQNATHAGADVPQAT